MFSKLGNLEHFWPLVLPNEEGAVGSCPMLLNIEKCSFFLKNGAFWKFYLKSKGLFDIFFTVFVLF
jgi:hypothetical protein